MVLVAPQPKAERQCKTLTINDIRCFSLYNARQIIQDAPIQQVSNRDWRIVKKLCLAITSYLCKKKFAMEKNPYIELAECLLPEEMIEYFDVVKVEKIGSVAKPG